jgi:hypothetical protein
VNIDGYWIDNWIYWITISYTTRLQRITLYNSQQLSLFSCSEDPAPTAATNSYGIPCHYSLTLSLTNCSWLTEDSSYIASGPDPKENASIVVLPVVCCVFIRPLLSNGCLTSVSTVDCWLGPLLSNGRNKRACHNINIQTVLHRKHITSPLQSPTG